MPAHPRPLSLLRLSWKELNLRFNRLGIYHHLYSNWSASPTPGPRKMDHQSQNSTTTSSIPGTGIWGTILKSKGGPYDVRMTDDTGTPVNWIHPDLIKRCKLDRETCRTEMFKDFHGKPFKVKEYVWFTWVGRLDDKTYAGVFYPAPRESEIDVLLGDDFVKTNGRAQDVCAPERRLKDMRLFAQSSMSASVPLNHPLNLRTSSMLIMPTETGKEGHSG